MNTEGRAFSFSADAEGVATHVSGQSSHDPESEPGRMFFPCGARRQTGEFAPEFLLILFRKTGAGIGNADRDFISQRRRRHFHEAAMGSVFDGIGNQVVENLPRRSGVSLGIRGLR